MTPLTRVQVINVDGIFGFKSDGIHATNEIDSGITNQDQAEVKDHGGQISQVFVGVGGNVIDFTADDHTSAAAKASKQVDLAMSMASLASRPGMRHWSQKVPFGAESVKASRRVKVKDILVSISVATKDIDIILDFTS